MRDASQERVPPKGALEPLEIATTAVLGGVAAMLVMVGWWLPHASVIGAAGAIPFGVVAHRHRPRAVVASTVGASSVAFLMAGTGPVSSVATCALIGGLVGDGKRRGWGLTRVLGFSAIIGPILAAAADGLLALFAALRILTLAQIRNSVHGLTVLAAKLPGIGDPARAFDRFVRRALTAWWITTAVIIVVGVLAATLMVWVVLGAVLERLEWLRATDRLDRHEGASPGPPSPVPVALVDVTYRYPGATADSLVGVSLSVCVGEFVAVTGDNGSGKSTLTRLFAGRLPTTGRIDRPGPVGLGRPGGTAMIFQRPESQVLGVRVCDDVVWGLPGGHAVDVDGLLATVGLPGMGGRETSSLSGGELQRLAVAAALARQPRLLIPDESTSMVDADGRRLLSGLYASLPAERGVSVVHVTHRQEEVAPADRVIHLSHGRVLAVPDVLAVPAASRAEPELPWATGGPGSVPAPGALRIDHVSHIWAQATPWATPALSDVHLDLPAGSGVVVVGGNGSGKSTLAWVMAGLLRPSTGGCYLDDQPVLERVGAVGLAFQHARLQVQRPTVRSDVRAAGGVSGPAADEALAAVGLDPDELGGRHSDDLSGGQLRRVALAGLLARQSPVLVLDEPLAGLDRPSTVALLGLLADLRHRYRRTLIVISHDIEGLEQVCDRVVRLEKGCVVGDHPLVRVAS